jgi:4'-phosphopantetheinyl transferase
VDTAVEGVTNQLDDLCHDADGLVRDRVVCPVPGEDERGRLVAVSRWRGVGFPPAPGQVGAPWPDVHVWLLDLDQPAWSMPRLCETLDAGERARAGALVFRADRTRFTAAHGLVRHVLASYLAIAPAQVTYGYGRYGKPHLVVSGDPDLRFNVSRSAGRCLCAVALNREVGVDIERIRRDRDHAGIAERYFAPAERAAIRGLPAEQLVPAFYACWTRKEAHLKAVGDGLSVPLDSFDVPVSPDPRPGPVAAACVSRGPRLRALPALPGFAAALAVSGDGGGVTTFTLDPPDRIPLESPLG